MPTQERPTDIGQPGRFITSDVPVTFEPSKGYTVEYKNNPLTFPSKPKWFRTLEAMNQMLETYAASGGDAVAVTRLYMALETAGREDREAAWAQRPKEHQTKCRDIAAKITDASQVELLVRFYEMKNEDNNRSSSGSALAGSNCSVSHEIAFKSGALRERLSQLRETTIPQ